MDDSIVVGTDGSETAKQAVAEAVRLAKALDAPVHVVSAYEPLRGARVTGAPEGPPRSGIRCPTTRSRRSSARPRPGCGSPASRSRRTRSARTRRCAPGGRREVKATMIVVGSKGMHGARRLALGNVPNKVSHQARCNVLIVATD